MNSQHLRIRDLAFVVVFAFALVPPYGGLSAQDASDVPRQSNLADRVDVERYIAESREMLQLFQIGESQLALFSDGQKLSDDGFATLIRLLYRAPAFPLHKVHRWQQWEWSLAELRGQPNRYRGAFLKLTGQASSIERIAVPEPFRQRFDFDHFFRVALTDSAAKAASIVYCRSIPVGWSASPPSDNGIRDGAWASTSAMFVKLAEPTGPSTSMPQPIVAVANTIAWHPKQVEDAAGITSDHVQLAEYGMDINQFSFVEDRKPLTTSDRECFYQLIDTANRIAQTETGDAETPVVDVTEILQNPESHRARHYALVGTVRRAVKIQVDDIDIVERFGIDHYYELEIFTNPEVTVRFVDENGDDKVFNRYPIVVCVKSVPEWLPMGEGIHANVMVSGFFLKHWAYKTQYMSAGPTTGSAERLQISPLLVGTRIRQYEPVVATSKYWGLVGGTLFVIGLVAIAYFVRRSEKSNQEFRRERLKRSPVDLDSVARNVQDADRTN